MSITFEVIDTACEQANQSFFVPQVRLSAKSTTSFATVRGYSEFVPSHPPKKYRRVDVAGVAERIGFTMEETPRMAAGAMYTWSGFSEINLQGVLTSSYSKKFFAQCPKQYWPIVPIQINSFATYPTNSLIASRFVGYCWPSDLNSCPVCDPDLINWPLIGDVTSNNLMIDLSAFRTPVNGITVTSTSYINSGQFAGFTDIGSPPHTSVLSGHHWTATVGGISYDAESAFVDPELAFPIVYITGIQGAYINFIDANNFSAILSEEYTDAEALANATVVLGTGTTAQTTPRTTGFTSIFTAVVFTLNLSNLIDGKDYVVEVDMWEKGVGPTGPISTHTPKQYGFTATGDTHTITDVVATPTANRTITVQKPTITFAPLPT